MSSLCFRAAFGAILFSLYSLPSPIVAARLPQRTLTLPVQQSLIQCPVASQGQKRRVPRATAVSAATLAAQILVTERRAKVAPAAAGKYLKDALGHCPSSVRRCCARLVIAAEGALMEEWDAYR